MKFPILFFKKPLHKIFVIFITIFCELYLKKKTFPRNTTNVYDALYFFH